MEYSISGSELNMSHSIAHKPSQMSLILPSPREDPHQQDKKNCRKILTDHLSNLKLMSLEKDLSTTTISSKVNWEPIDQYHGQENLGSSYKYIVKVSRKTLYIPQLLNFTFLHFCHFHTILSFCHTISRCMLILLHTLLDPFSLDNPRWRRSEN